MRLGSFFVLAALVLAACAPATAPPAVSALTDVRQSPCDATDVDDERFVVDWSPLDRSKLEATARRGVVPVRIDGCRARIVDGCSVRRSYTFAATSRQREVMRLRDRDEVRAKLPILAMRFGAGIEKATSFEVAMTVVGRYESAATAVSAADLDGECEGATHVVASLSVGAFAVDTESSVAESADIDLAHAGRARERRHLDAAGTESACTTARRSDSAPPDDCSVPLRMELRALRATTVAPPAPKPAVPDSDAMKHAVAAVKKELAWCHRVARASAPDMSGTLTLSVKLARNGNVRSVGTKLDGDLDDSLATCAIERVGHVTFPPSDDDRPRAIVIPVLFRALAR